MESRLLTTALAFWALSCGMLAGGREAEAAEPKPNILLILSDDHSGPTWGLRESDIDAESGSVGGGGMRFDRAYVACPQCVPSRAAIMTGRAPVDIQMTRFSAPLPPGW
jgi:arylsulfatase A-like enzyme